MNTAQQILAQMFAQNVSTGTCQSDINDVDVICSTEGGDPLCGPGTFSKEADALFGNAICSTEGGDPVCHGSPQIDHSRLFGGMTTRPVTDELPTFDLKVVFAKVAKDNPTLPEAVLKAGESQYREFLRQSKLNPTSKVSPNLFVDEFWHAHILHTEKYVSDCAEYFGYYFHHRPI
jgi:hypothetical protein